MESKSSFTGSNAAAAATHAKYSEPESVEHPVCPYFSELLRRVCGHCLRTAAAFVVGYSFAVTAWRVRHEPKDLAFVLAASFLLVALLVCLRRAERLAPDSPAGERRRVQAAVWALSTALSCAFAYRVAPAMPLALAVLLWCTTAFVALAGLYVVVLCREYQALPTTMPPAAGRRQEGLCQNESY